MTVEHDITITVRPGPKDMRNGKKCGNISFTSLEQHLSR